MIIDIFGTIVLLFLFNLMFEDYKQTKNVTSVVISRTIHQIGALTFFLLVHYKVFAS